MLLTNIDRPSFDKEKKVQQTDWYEAIPPTSWSPSNLFGLSLYTGTHVVFSELKSVC